MYNCKECKAPFKRYSELKNHFYQTHGEKFRQIQRYLADEVRDAETMADRYASEGLSGYSGSNPLPLDIYIKHKGYLRKSFYR